MPKTTQRIRSPHDVSDARGDGWTGELAKWQVEALARNCYQPSWSPGEDYMASHDERGWNGAIRGKWSEEDAVLPDDLNWIAGWYFYADAHYEPGVGGSDLTFGICIWLLHPRKGASRGAEYTITEADVPSVIAALRDAARQNAQRWAGLEDGAPYR